ncbi:MAG: 1-deoxy-D-xylulose-5-phosphate reductoisomerase, partial [Treponema sp.]|nr:1-deoxy-D-xylulose-5-phosphate reductoisomerase [Treponema sp.]
MKKRIAVLGATGSIGKSAIDIILRDRERFDVVLLCARSNRNELEKLKSQFPCAVCVLTSEESGKEKLINAIGDARPELTINGISGSAGLEPSLAAIKAGSDLALANKETVVMAGDIIFRLAKEKNVKIIPVDSEHSAIYKLL